MCTAIMEPLDHKMIDLDVPYFEEHPRYEAKQGERERERKRGRREVRRLGYIYQEIELILLLSDLYSTVENIAVFIWHNMRKVMPKPDMLYEIWMEETDKNFAIYRGEVTSM